MGRYYLQADLVKQGRGTCSSCPLCKSEPESIVHFVSTCPALEETRTHHQSRIAGVVRKSGRWPAGYCIAADPLMFTHVVIDAEGLGITLDEGDTYRLEKMTRQLLYALHQRRSSLLEQQRTGQ